MKIKYIGRAVTYLAGHGLIPPGTILECQPYQREYFRGKDWLELEDFPPEPPAAMEALAPLSAEEEAALAEELQALEEASPSPEASPARKKSSTRPRPAAAEAQTTATEAQTTATEAQTPPAHQEGSASASPPAHQEAPAHSTPEEEEEGAEPLQLPRIGHFLASSPSKAKSGKNAA